MYISNTLYVLRGLPQDLEPREVAMLHRALPPAAAAAYAGPGGVPGKPGSSAGGSEADGRNMVHILVLFCLCWLYSAAEWLMPKVAVCGSRIVKAEQEHGYIPRLMLALSRLFRVFVEMLRWLGDCALFQMLGAFVAYALSGIRGAMLEFTDRSLERKTAVVEVKEPLKAWM